TLALPVVLVGGVIIAYGVFWISGLSLHDIQAGGWTFASHQSQGSWHFLAGADFSAFPWHIAPPLAGDALAAVLVTSVSALVNVTAIEVSNHHEADLENELKVIGWANIASAAVGGYAGSAATSGPVLNERVGGTGRLSGLTAALITALAITIGPSILEYLPKFVVAG